MRLPILLLTLLLLALSTTADAQRRRKPQEPVWPPERAYGRTTLGAALQNVFSKHYDFCGFTKPSGKRDYTPPTIERFLGKRNLRTRVESANINGGNLLSYVFTAEEAETPLQLVRYRPGQLLYTEADGINLLPEPRPGFDAFVLTKNCSGYLKSALDVGLKPPYAAFQAALNTDAKRNSSVLAMAGSFVSPLSEILGANDARTNEIMAKLWAFYNHSSPAALRDAQKLYYLKQFDGVLVKHLTDAQEIMASEQNLGVNVTLPLAAKVHGEVGRRRENSAEFSGSDWGTIVFTDFEGPYTRQALFEPLPGPDEIEDYFRSRPVAYAADATPAPLREGGNHRHSVVIPGLPPGYASAGWTLENVSGNAYGTVPSLQVDALPEGLRFTVEALSSGALFALPQEEIPVSYDLVLNGNGHQLRIPVNQRFTASRQPLVDLAGTRFELRRKNNGQYAFQWHLTMDVEDRENPLDASGRLEATNVTAGYEDQPLSVRVVSTEMDPRRGLLYLTLESERTWPLADIDDRNMRSFPLSLQVCLPVVDGYTLCRRPLETRIAVPWIRNRGVRTID